MTEKAGGFVVQSTAYAVGSLVESIAAAAVAIPSLQHHHHHHYQGVIIISGFTSTTIITTKRKKNRSMTKLACSLGDAEQLSLSGL